MTSSIYDKDLDKNAANYVPLSPVTFLKRAATVYPNKIAVVHGDRRITYRDLHAMVTRFASALVKRGIRKGDTVSILAPNIPEMLAAHYAVPLIGAVLNSINTRLDAPTIAFILEHGESKFVISDKELNPVMEEALAQLGKTLPVIDIDDPMAKGGKLIGEKDFDAFLEEGDADYEWSLPEDEWQAICLNYTSGTTGNPKGVVYHHRGAYLNAMGNAVSFGLTPTSVYLWTLPMFHCNGWSYTWAVTAVGGTHVCLRAVDPALIFPSIRDNKVTHMCGAPIVLTMLIHAPADVKCEFPQVVEVATGGAAPPSAVISNMEKLGFHVTHLYGMTECYGPSAICAWQDEWNDLSMEDKASKVARQGVALVTLEEQRVVDSETMEDVPADGETIGELVMRGNTVMRGYLKNPAASDAAFKGGWLHTGDLAVMHPDSYIEVKDRSKDIIISGGENISSLEIEEVLYKHPDIMEAAVVAAPHEKWGETPSAYVTLKAESEGKVSAEDVIAYCRSHMAHYKAPTKVTFGPLPKTSTGKIQKFVLRDLEKTGE
ncbi:acyl-CoA synthetase [Hwanghaeella grinnelliae]|uniref:3-methylmercaptopropionyl-CoA ligase n=1 Tax=Hwanghaeella grinnelliae TaxID=2500179 RepID=A0A3S2VTH6_9PROT|nr:acyl-CoA synthetase [Hwanghaeella grinnelliae]RVU39430.1 acyl-CoA synthetase [Hwanghaeella grinnelliae]